MQTIITKYSVVLSVKTNLHIYLYGTVFAVIKMIKCIRFKKLNHPHCELRIVKHKVFVFDFAKTQDPRASFNRIQILLAKKINPEACIFSFFELHCKLSIYPYHENIFDNNRLFIVYPYWL